MKVFIELRHTFHTRIFLAMITLLCFGSTSYAQLADIAHELPIATLPKIASHNGVDYLSNQSPRYNGSPQIEGAMIVLFASTEQVSVQFRFRNAQNVWSDWAEAAVLNEPYSDRLYAGYHGVLAAESVQFEYRVNSPSPKITVTKTGLFKKETEQTPSLDFRLRPKKKSPSNIRKPKIITRQEWGARNPKVPYDAQPYYDKLTLHHAAGFRADNLEEGIEQMQAIQILHQDIRGWNDIGYHFVVDRAGNIYQARPEYVIGAHVGGANTGNTGVCVLGCYHPPEANCNDRITQASLDSLIVLYGWIADTYEVDPDVLLGHRDYFGTTACPGDNLWGLLGYFRTEITEYIERDGIPNIFYLTQNYPNPFNPSTTISYHLPVSDNVELTIYSTRGYEVRHLLNALQSAGEHAVEWDGRDDSGQRVASGMYLYVFKTSTRHEKRPMMLVK